MGCTWDKTFENASDDLSNVKNWFNHKSLIIKLSKTKGLPIITRSHSDTGLRLLKIHSCDDFRSVTCGCGIIKCVDQYSYLSNIVDQNLSWGPYAQSVDRRLRKLF